MGRINNEKSFTYSRSLVSTCVTTIKRYGWRRWSSVKEESASIRHNVKAGLGLWGAYKGYSETAKIEDSGKRLAAQGLLVSTVSSVGSGLGVLYLLRSNSALSKEVAEANKEIKLIREKMQEAPSEEAQRRALVLERGAEASILAHHKIGRIPTLPKGKKVLNETDAQLLERIHGELDQGNDDAASEVGN